MWKGRRARRLGRVLPALPMPTEHGLGLGVPGLEVAVTKRPSRRESIAVFERLEIALTVTDEDRAVELGIASKEIVISRVEAHTPRVPPGFLRPPDPICEDGGGGAGPAFGKPGG